VHKGTVYPGEHKAIISQELWDKAHNILRDSPRRRAARTRAQTPALLKGLIFGPTGCAMSPTHTRKGGRLYRYYVSRSVLKHGPDACPVGRIAADEIETAVVDQLRVYCGRLKSLSARGARRGNRWATSRKLTCVKRWCGSILSGTNSSPPSRRASCKCS
jgi:hypothetical protein